jgi:hypothetical protein
MSMNESSERTENQRSVSLFAFLICSLFVDAADRAGLAVSPFDFPLRIDVGQILNTPLWRMSVSTNDLSSAD